MEQVDKVLLKHADVPYDPAKRREYYLKTRELKGRRTRKGDTAPQMRSGPRKLTAKEVKFIKAATGNRAQVEQRRQSIETRVKVLNEKLKKLRAVLKGLKDQSDKQKSPEAKKKEDTKKEDPKDLTTAQKKERAKKAKEQRDKEAKSSPDQRLKEVMDKIDAVKKQIEEVRAKLQKGQRQKAEGNSQNGT